MYRVLTALISSTCLASLLSGVSHAEEYEDMSGLELIHVVGTAVDRASIPGSATRLNSDDLERFQYDDVLKVMRFIPGVNIQEEDGFGLRPNIGLRGTGVERSAKITLMEDGVLIAPAPYAASSAYYFPTIARMQAVEVRKGSAAVKFGPRTVGGAINLVSRDIPSEFSGFVDVKYGSFNQKTFHGVVGGQGEKFGALLEYVNSNNDGFKHLPSEADTGYDIEDVMAKFSWKISDTQNLLLKLSNTKQTSNETYLGLSQADFASDPYQRYAASALDQMNNDHDQVQLTHSYEADNVSLMTTIYQNNFERDWFKIGGSITDENIAILRGEEDSSIGALSLKHNARSYTSKGIQSAAKIEQSMGGADHTLEMSVRYHEDHEDRLQYSEKYTMISGQMEFASAGLLGSAGNRLAGAKAWAFMVQDTIEFDKITLVPGLRYESIKLSRLDWNSDDPNRTSSLKSEKENTVTSFIPGLGVSYQVSDALLFTGGVYKGFNPPGPGSVEGGAENEVSLSFEAGLVYSTESINIELMSFYSDYSNILGTCMEANCSTAEVGDQFNGGKAEIYGLESTASYQIHINDEWSMPLRAVYTYTHSTFKTAFSDGFWGDVVAGDAMPYTPSHQINLELGLESEQYSLNVSMNHVSSARAEAGSGTILNDVKIDARTVFDVSGSFQISDALNMFLSVQNITDQTYVVARRPIGLRPGKPRSFTVGLQYTF